MTFNDIVFQMFRRVIWKLLRGVLGPLAWGPSGGLLEASWRPLGGLLGAPRGSFGGSGGRLEVKHNFGGLAFFGRAVMELSWGRFLNFSRPFLNQI